MDDRSTELRYPRLIRRVEAVLLDALVIVAMFILAMNLLSQVDIHGGYKAAIVVLAFFVLEPGMVSFTGSSIGHHLRGLRVQDARTGANIGLFRAVVRVVAKSFLGWFSIVFMLVTKRHQTIHDMVVSSVVVFKNPETVAEGHALEEREIEEAGYSYPSNGRRIIVIIAYILLASVVCSVGVVLLSSEDCVQFDRCSNTDLAWEALFSIIWICLLTASIVLGWRGRLPGARRTPLSDG